MKRFALMPCLAVVFAVAAGAQDVYLLDYARHLEGSVELEGLCGDYAGQGAASVGDFEPGFWHEALRVTTEDPNIPGPDAITGSAIQYSDITTNLLRMIGSLQLDAEFHCVGDEVERWESQGYVESTYRVQFVTVAPVVLLGTGSTSGLLQNWSDWDAYDMRVGAVASIRVGRIAGETVYEDEMALECFAWSDPVSDGRPLSLVAELGPGIYEVEISVSLSHSGMQTNPYDEIQARQIAELTHILEFSFEPVEPGGDCEYIDSDDDGDIDLHDFYRFQQCFSGPGA